LFPYFNKPSKGKEIDIMMKENLPSNDCIAHFSHPAASCATRLKWLEYMNAASQLLVINSIWLQIERTRPVLKRFDGYIFTSANPLVTALCATRLK
jgi:hypothetical protein